ncbi:MAG: DUF835 domain-containing protein [Thermoplasmata archaeon]|jgi:hypothetical protein|nr:DUF835 domain-containing protein [Thermoplasmata archaeon]
MADERVQVRAPMRGTGILLGALMFMFLSAQAAPCASALDGAPISVTFEFLPADDAYFPGESFEVEFTVVNTIVSGDYVYDSLAYMEKVVNVSAHFSWMDAGESVWNNVSTTSSWLEPDGVGTGTYSLAVDVPATAAAQTYSYFFELEYLAHTAWGNITYYWGVGTTYHDLAVTLATSTAPAAATASVPAKVAPGDELQLEVNFTNDVPPACDGDDCFPVKAMWVEPRFSWMSEEDVVRTDVSSLSEWLAPDGAGFQLFSVSVQVPDDLPSGGYTYFLRVGYVEDAPWGEFAAEDDGEASSLTVEASATGDGPFLSGLALSISLIALAAVAVAGAFVYRMSKAGRGPWATAKGAYPLIRPLPGQVVHVEPSTVYLVKEDRPRMAFAMLAEAVERGATGMLVSREHPDRLADIYPFKAAVTLWLTRRAGKDNIDPTELSLLSLRIGKFAESKGKEVVLIEGMEYLITQNDFETVLRFVNHMHEFVSVHDCSVIFVVDPRVLSTRELALLERSARVVEPPEEKEAAPPGTPAEGTS